MAVGLTIDGQSFDIDGAWEHDKSIGRLLGALRSRGHSRLVPGSAGVLANPIRPTEVIVDLVLEVYGEKNNLGAAHADVFAGVTDNLIFLRDFVKARMDGTTKTVPAVFEAPGGRRFTTGVQILNWDIARHESTVAFVTYDLRIPSGVWTETA